MSINTCSSDCRLPVSSPQKVRRGDDWYAIAYFTMNTADGEVSPINLTGYTNHHACIYSKNPNNELGVITVEQTNPIEGKLTFRLRHDSEFFSNYPAATYSWQFSMVDTDGNKKTYIANSAFEVIANEH